MQNENKLIDSQYAWLRRFACGANYPSQERAIFLQRELPAQALKRGAILYFVFVWGVLT